MTLIVSTVLTPHGGNSNNGSEESDDSMIMAVVNRSGLLLKKEKLNLRKEELEENKKQFKINMRCRKAKGLHDFARMCMDLNMRGEWQIVLRKG